MHTHTRHTGPAPHPARLPDSLSRRRKISVFLFVLLTGFAMFAGPAVFFQMGNAGGYGGHNLALLGVLQLLLAGGVVLLGTRLLRIRIGALGLERKGWRRDAVMGALVGGGWALLQFAWLFPSTGGASRDDVAGILTFIDGQWINVLWYLPLGVLGGAVAEELYNRGFFITVLSDILGNGRLATAAAAILSILFFAAGHLPSGWIAWMDILVPTMAYTALYLWTRRLTASIVAHAVWNTLAVTGIYLIYGSG